MEVGGCWAREIIGKGIVQSEITTTTNSITITAASNPTITPSTRRPTPTSPARSTPPTKSTPKIAVGTTLTPTRKNSRVVKMVSRDLEIRLGRESDLTMLRPKGVVKKSLLRLKLVNTLLAP